MNVLITGAMGFVGRHLTVQLRQLGFSVTTLDRNENAEWCADLLDESKLALLSVTRQFDAVVHLAAILPGQANEETMHNINVYGTRNILRQFVMPHTHFLFLSTGLVYGTECNNSVENSELCPVNAYEKSKLEAERMVKEYANTLKCKATILRPSVLYGEDAPPAMFLRSMIETLRAGLPFSMTAGQQWRDFIHVDDACKAIGLVLQNKLEGTYNLSSHDRHQIIDVANFAAARSGKSELLRVGAIPYREQESFQYSLDSSLLRSKIPWVPTWTISKFILSQFP